MAAMAPISLEPVRNYLQQRQGWFFYCGQTSASDIAQSIFDSLEQSSPVDRAIFLQALKIEMLQNASQVARVDALKLALIPKGTLLSWKEAVLGMRHEKQIDGHWVSLCYSNSLDEKLDLPSRSVLFTAESMAAYFCSTFATNKLDRLSKKPEHILDSVYGSTCYNSQGAFTGFALAVADGSGGHFGDAKQDRLISRAAHFSAKRCCHLFASYENPDKLKQELLQVVNLVKDEVSRKGQGEGTTLVACRAFACADGFRLIGFNIGDGMLCGFDPTKKTFYSLLPSHVTEAGSAQFPRAYRAFEVQSLDVTLPIGTQLYLMTDGIHDHLPFLEEEKTYPNGLQYRIRSLNQINTLFASLPADATPTTYLSKLLTTCFEKAEEERSQQSAANMQMGDDGALLQCCLVTPQSTKIS